MLSEPPVPTGPYLYKFATLKLDFLRPVIARHELYARTAGEMNDPREMKPVVAALSAEEYAAAMTNYLFKLHPTWSDAERAHATAEMVRGAREWGAPKMQRQLQTWLHETFDQTRLYSMTKRWDNLAMWAHYAAEHTGYCLEFAREGLFAAAREVIYDASVSLNLNDPNAPSRYWFYHKHPDWRFEEEARIVFPIRTTPGPRIQFAPTSLARIILGKNADKRLVDEILALARSRTPPLKVEVTNYDAFTQVLSTCPL